MPTKRCCSRCSTPFQICALKSCRCHDGALSEDAQIVSIRDYLEGR